MRNESIEGIYEEALELINRKNEDYANPDDYSMIGLVPDPCEYYIPDTVTYLTVAEMKTRQLAIHAKYPMQKQNEDMSFSDMSDAEVEAEIDAWHTAHNS